MKVKREDCALGGRVRVLYAVRGRERKGRGWEGMGDGWRLRGMRLLMVCRCRGDRGFRAGRSRDGVRVRSGVFDPDRALSWATAAVLVAASFDCGAPLNEVGKDGFAPR